MTIDKRRLMMVGVGEEGDGEAVGNRSTTYDMTKSRLAV